MTIVVLFAVGFLTFQPAKAASLTILSHRGYLDSNGYYSIYGEFQNIENAPIRCENVSATFYDINNNILAMEKFPTNLPVVLPNEKMPFWGILYNDGVEIGKRVDHYELSVTVSHPSVTLVDTKILSYNSTIDSLGYTYFAGEVQNTGSINADFIEVPITCYDPSGKVVWATITYTFIGEEGTIARQVPPGQISSFKTIGIPPEIISEIANSNVVSRSYIIDYSAPPSEPSQPDGASSPSSDSLYVIWAPPNQNAAIATAVTVATVGVVSAVAAIGVSNPSSIAGKVCDKCRHLLPEGAKEWLEEYVSLKSKATGASKQKTSYGFTPTRGELIAYTVSVVALTIGFSYVEVTNINQLLFVIPTVLATAVLIEVVKTYTLEVTARRLGIRTEHKLWFFGLVLFIVTTFGFGVPFSSPSRNEYDSTEKKKRLNALVSIIAILLVLAFAAIFFVLLLGGFALIGSTGLAMCVILGLVDSFPISPMNGKTIFEYKKVVWASLFLLTLIVYVVWLLLL